MLLQTSPINAGNSLLYQDGILKLFDGTSWVSSSGLSAINLTSLTNNDILIWDSTPGKWVNTPSTGTGSNVLQTSPTINTPNLTGTLSIEDFIAVGNAEYQGEIFYDSCTFRDGSIVAGGTLVFGTNNTDWIRLVDNAELRFGTGNDIQLAFDGTDFTLDRASTTETFQIEPPIFVMSGGTQYSRFGPAPTVLAPSDAVDTLVAVKAGTGVAGFRAVGEWNSAGASASASFGANCFLYVTGAGNATNTATGLIANRCAFRHNSTGLVTLAVGCGSYAEVLTGIAGDITTAVGFRAEKNYVGASGSTIATSINFESNGCDDSRGGAITDHKHFAAVSSPANSCTNEYGLYIPQPTGGSTLNYAIMLTGSTRVNLGTLPTSSAGLATGDLYTTAGALMVA